MRLIDVTHSRRAHTFVCDDGLWRRLEARATALECSVDWLISEKRVSRVILRPGDVVGIGPFAIGVEPLRNGSIQR